MQAYFYRSTNYRRLLPVLSKGSFKRRISAYLKPSAYSSILLCNNISARILPAPGDTKVEFLVLTNLDKVEFASQAAAMNINFGRCHVHFGRTHINRVDPAKPTLVGSLNLNVRTFQAMSFSCRTKKLFPSNISYRNQGPIISTFLSTSFNPAI